MQIVNKWYFWPYLLYMETEVGLKMIALTLLLNFLFLFPCAAALCHDFSLVDSVETLNAESNSDLNNWIGLVNFVHRAPMTLWLWVDQNFRTQYNYTWRSLKVLTGGTIQILQIFPQTGNIPHKVSLKNSSLYILHIVKLVDLENSTLFSGVLYYISTFSTHDRLDFYHTVCSTLEQTTEEYGHCSYETDCMVESEVQSECWKSWYIVLSTYIYLDTTRIQFNKNIMLWSNGGLL